MKILYIQNIRLPTEKAHGLQIMETCAALAAAGHEVTLAVSSWQSSDQSAIFDYYDLPETFSIVKVPCLSLPSWGKAGFFISSVIFFLSAKRIFRWKEYDAVYTRDDILVRPGFFYEMHDARGLFQSLALRRAAGTVVITRGLADHCRSVGVSKDRLCVAPDGVDLKRFDISESREACRAKLALPADKKIILYSGHLYSWKGADVLARAAGLLDADALVVFVGGTDRDIALFRGRFGSNPRIRVVGRAPRGLIPYYLKAADVLVLPNSGKENISRLYTSPLKLFEYMAAGRPVVASDLPSTREILDESNAVLVKPDDPEALAEGIKRALNDESLAGEISQRARKDVEQYAWAVRGRLIIDFMEERTKKAAVKGLDFYDKASATYSDKRYPAKSFDYTHFFFKRRLTVTLSILERIVPRMDQPSLIEVGCADGVVLRRILDEFGDGISSYVGIDASMKMIETAKAKHAGTRLGFRVRHPGERFGTDGKDIIVEIGVLNYADFEYELRCASKGLLEGGIYICSIAGKGSLWDSFRKSDTGFKNFMTYGEYERVLARSFDIVSKYPVGLYTPLIWRLPWLGRIIQPIAEWFFWLFAPALFHEKVYALKKKSALKV